LTADVNIASFDMPCLYMSHFVIVRNIFLYLLATDVMTLYDMNCTVNRLLCVISGIYEIFCGNKNFYVGKQPDPFPGTSNTVCLCECVC